MKTQNKKKLVFTKASILELNDGNMVSVYGGTTPIGSIIIRTIAKSSAKCASAISISITWPGKPLE